MATISQVERSAMHRIVSWMKEIIQKEELPFTVDADIELQIHERKRKFPDIIIFANYPNEIVCLVEYKPPDLCDPYDSELVDDAYQEACEAPGTFYGTCRYFGTWNTNKFVLWDRKDYDVSSYLAMRYKHYEVTNARNINDITRTMVEEAIKRFLRGFLIDLYGLYYEKKPLPALPIDELFIYRLRTAIDTFFIPISEKIFREAKQKPTFKKKLRRWFAEQGWLFKDNLDDYDRAARQRTYLIVDKVLFYDTLRLHKKGLGKIKLPKNITGEEFKSRLGKYFDRAMKEINYEPIFETNFLETLPLPDKIIPQIVSFINTLSEKYNFSKIGYEIIGRVFERLIPKSERHKLGQYYTRSDVVDLINAFCIKSPNDVILDPACGAGTFLIRAYSLIKHMKPSKSHGKLFKQLYGMDISKFAAHLSTINLSIRDLSKKENYPRIINADFFDVNLEKLILRKYRVKKPSGALTEIKIPSVDVVVGNPPYTRQEIMEDVFEARYKEKLDMVIKRDFRYGIGKRAGIYAYFFIHGAKFLKEGGRFGFVTSNSWLDVGFGKYLQYFFLDKFKIKAIVESKVERWFEDADINTCITILERCDNKEKRESNLVKFVQLKVPLMQLVSTTDSGVERLNTVKKLVDKVEKIDEFYEDEEIKIFPKKQNALLKEIGVRWSRYIKAPKIFFEILSENFEKFVSLKKLAKVQWGSLKTGADKFFYLTEKEIKNLGIEKEFWMHKENGKLVPNYIIKSPKECKGIVINQQDLKYRVLMIHKDKKDIKDTNVLKYIKWGEEEEFHIGPTCASRHTWYDLGREKIAPILWPGGFWNRFMIFYNKPKVLADRRLFNISPYGNAKLAQILCALLNSTLINLFAEVYEKTVFGQGLLLADTYVVEQIPILNVEKIDKQYLNEIRKVFIRLAGREIGSIFEEIGADRPGEVRLDKVKKDRRKLDEIVFDILGLSKKKRLEVYEAVVDLVRSRIERARSVKKRSKKIKFDVGAFAENILEETRIKELKKFPDEYVTTDSFKEIKVPDGIQVEIGSDLFHGVHVKLGEEIMKCKSYEEAEYIEYAIQNGNKIVKMPKDERILKKAVKEYGELVNEIKAKVEKTLDEIIPDKRVKEQVRKEILKKIFKRNK